MFAVKLQDLSSGLSSGLLFLLLILCLHHGFCHLKQGCQTYSTKGHVAPTKQQHTLTLDLTLLIYWCQSSGSWLSKLGALNWLEQKPASTRPFLDPVTCVLCDDLSREYSLNLPDVMDTSRSLWHRHQAAKITDEWIFVTVKQTQMHNKYTLLLFETQQWKKNKHGGSYVAYTKTIQKSKWEKGLSAKGNQTQI